MKYRCKYEFTIDLYPRHTWSLVGRHLGIHLHIGDLSNRLSKDPDGGLSGGIEFHFRAPPEHMGDEAPSQDHCWLLKAPCWHDGSSLQASEVWIPQWLELRGVPDEHERMFELLEAEAENHTMTTLEIVSKMIGKGES